jgi:MFS family permease
MAAGTVCAGWLSDRFRCRKIPAIVAGLASTPALWLMGQATTLWGLAVGLAAWFFCAGLLVALISIAAGLRAEISERGKVFGIPALTAELGAILGGGLALGPIGAQTIRHLQLPGHDVGPADPVRLKTSVAFLGSVAAVHPIPRRRSDRKRTGDRPGSLRGPGPGFGGIQRNHVAGRDRRLPGHRLCGAGLGYDPNPAR